MSLLVMTCIRKNTRGYAGDAVDLPRTGRLGGGVCTYYINRDCRRREESYSQLLSELN